MKKKKRKEGKEQRGKKNKNKAKGSQLSSVALETWPVQFFIFIISVLLILNPFNTPLLVL